VVNVIFIAIITFFIVYWIREMQRNPDKARH
jgi:large-conductance mechanosensitive channel